jgi:hypothetical protein
MQQRLRRPAALEYTMFRGSEALAAGLLSTKALRGPGWTRLRYDVFADSRLERDHELACRAAALVLPEHAVIAGRSAAFMLGVEHAASFADEVCVIVPPSDRRPRQKLVVHRTDLDPADIEMMSFARRTTALRTAWDVAAWEDKPTAVAILDTMLRQQLVTEAQLTRMLTDRCGRRGIRRARWAFGLADPRPQSPQESRMRARLVMAGLPTPVPQYPVRLKSGRVLHPDVAWPEYRVGAEYDGDWHAEEGPMDLDRRRGNMLTSHEWLILRATKHRMGRGFPGFVREVRDTLVARGWRP